MSKVAIITDSTAYIPQELVEKHKITVLPLVLIWDEQTMEDGVDILPTEFYTRLETSETIPTTSQVTVVHFKNAYERLLQEGYDILNILISDQLSGTIDSAVQALEFFPDENIEIVNSKTIAMALGFIVLEAARAAANGASLAECKSIAEDAKNRVGVVFAVDTLKFLHKGGRIGGATRFLGTALKLKPILEITGGRVEAIERVRTKRKAHHRLVELLAARTNDSGSVKLATLHANAIDDARALLDDAKSYLGNVDDAIYSEVSPVVGTHAGPGTVGLAYIVNE
ncbi:MAG: DegV family protein [Chloroflexota bacterium]|nr:DegV family protein [Chloroflexota bacterium]